MNLPGFTNENRWFLGTAIFMTHSRVNGWLTSILKAVKVNLTMYTLENKYLVAVLAATWW